MDKKLVELCRRMLKAVGDRNQRVKAAETYKTPLSKMFVELGDLLEPPN